MRRVLIPTGLLLAAAVLYALRGDSPGAVAQAYLTAWAQRDADAEYRLTTAEAPPPVKGTGRGIGLSALVRQSMGRVRFRSLSVIGDADVDGDSASVPAEASIDGQAAARLLVESLPTSLSPPLEKRAASVLNRTFPFSVGLQRSRGHWKVDRDATETSLTATLASDPRVREVAGEIKANTLQSLKDNLSVLQDLIQKPRRLRSTRSR